MSRLLLVRHGNTNLDNATRFWGKTDMEMSLSGIRQVESLRDRLATQKINAAYSSRLKRARATAEIITAGTLKVVPVAGLDEVNFGWIEGLTFEEVKKLHPDIAGEMESWNIRQKFPGGESLDDVNRRLQGFLERLGQHKPGETVLVAAHGGTLRALICNLLGIGIEHWRQIRIDLASLTIVETYPEGAILNLLNDTSHLK